MRIEDRLASMRSYPDAHGAIDLAIQLAGLLREIDNWGSLPHAYRCNVTLQVGEPEHPPICDCDARLIAAKMHAMLDGEGGGDE